MNLIDRYTNAKARGDAKLWTQVRATPFTATFAALAGLALIFGLVYVFSFSDSKPDAWNHVKLSSAVFAPLVAAMLFSSRFRR
jgi:hypothetical protein